MYVSQYLYIVIAGSQLYPVNAIFLFQCQLFWQLKIKHFADTLCLNNAGKVKINGEHFDIIIFTFV